MELKIDEGAIIEEGSIFSNALERRGLIGGTLIEETRY